MPTRPSYAGSIAAADLITAANNNKLPGGLVAYAWGNGSQTYTGGGSSDVEFNLGADLGLQLTYTPVNASRSLLIMASVAVRPTTTLSVPDIVYVRLEKDGDQIDASSEDFDAGTTNPPTARHTHTIKCSTVDIGPTAIAHTYRLFFHIYGDSGQPNISHYQVGHGATGIQIFDMGPSF